MHLSVAILICAWNTKFIYIIYESLCTISSVIFDNEGKVDRVFLFRLHLFFRMSLPSVCL